MEFKDDFNLLDRLEDKDYKKAATTINSSEEKETFLDYLQTEQGYTKEEVEEVDQYMNENYGDYWNKQEVKVPSFWQRVRIWFLKLFYGYRDGEYERYKKRLEDEKHQTGLSRRQIRQRLREERQLSKETAELARIAAGRSRTKKGLSDKSKKALMTIAVVGGAVLVGYLVYKSFKKRR